MQFDSFYGRLRDIYYYAIELGRAVWDQPYSREILIAIGVLAVLLVIIVSVRRNFAPIKLFNNSAGWVTVTPKALDELVQSVCYSMGSLNRPSVSVHSKRGRLWMTVSLKLEMGQKLSEVSSSIQEELTNALRDHLGVEKLGRIDVRIKGFKGILRKPAPVFRPLEEIAGTDSCEVVNDPFTPNH